MLAPQHPSRTRILDAALGVIRSKGYAATSVDDLCTAAGLTKGGFFHHFRGKEDLALAAAAHFSAMADGLFAAAPYRRLEDPLQRLLGYVDFRIAILKGRLPQFTCLLGTLLQETYETHPAIREACDRYISSHAAQVAADVALARDWYVPDAPWTADSLALHTQAVIQGAFILAKARGGPEVAADSLRHLRRYIEFLFDVPATEETAP
jgi:TetR/AcrR family transcriptional regulator, transcriptional repressor for nem operon